MIYRTKKSVGTIKSQWMGWFPQVGFDAGFWVTVSRLARERKVRDKASIVAICNEVHNRRKV